MLYGLAVSILKQQIRIGQATIPMGLIPLLIICFAVVIGLNVIYLNQYRRIMIYLERNHPDIYEQVRPKPDIGPFYSNAYHRSKALIALAKQPQTLNDPQLEQKLFEFIQFDQKFTVFSSIVIVIMMLAVFIVGVVLTL